MILVGFPSQNTQNLKRRVLNGAKRMLPIVVLRTTTATMIDMWPRTSLHQCSTLVACSFASVSTFIREIGIPSNRGFKGTKNTHTNTQTHSHRNSHKRGRKHTETRGDTQGHTGTHTDTQGECDTKTWGHGDTRRILGAFRRPGLEPTPSAARRRAAANRWA